MTDGLIFRAGNRLTWFWQGHVRFGVPTGVSFEITKRALHCLHLSAPEYDQIFVPYDLGWEKQAAIEARDDSPEWDPIAARIHDKASQ